MEKFVVATYTGIMNPILSDEQRAAMQSHPSGPLYVDDPLTQTQYVLLPAEAYLRVCNLLSTSLAFSIDETLAAQDEVARAAGWDDPMMDDYNDYDAHRPPT
jgi:hypothetical protein